MITTLEDAASDAGAFAEVVLDRPLWRHQLELARSPARYRVVCAGRQVGKSSVLAAIALHTAATRRNALVLVVSAGENAANRLLDECAGLAEASPLLRGSVLDEAKTLLTMRNGSQIRAVPASQRQIRGWPVDLLILDEAGFVDQEIWRSAEPAIIARPGSRVILSSTPYGLTGHFFRELWRRGMDHPDDHVASWHWPSTASPLVDKVLLEQIRSREAPDYFAREYMAEWTSDAGAYFTEEELNSCIADYELLSPADAREASPQAGAFGRQRVWAAAAGLDWGFKDANAIALVSPLDDLGLNADALGAYGCAVFVPWLEARHRWSWSEFTDYVIDTVLAYDVTFIASEINGVGDFATFNLAEKLGAAWEPRMGGYYGQPIVRRISTTARRKMAGFGRIKGLIGERRLVLPRHPELLSQLRALEFEQRDSGMMHIAVPESRGHDDYPMALLQAVSCVMPARLFASESADARQRRAAFDDEDIVSTSSGIRLPRRPGPLRSDGDVDCYWAHAPEGQRTGDDW